MKNKYNVGDIVRVKKDLENYKTYGCDYFVPRMRTNTICIEHVCVNNGDFYYRVGDFSYTEEMLDGLEDTGEFDDLIKVLEKHIDKEKDLVRLLKDGSISSKDKRNAIEKEQKEKVKNTLERFLGLGEDDE